MEEYNINNEELDFLRKNTRLNPIAATKVLIARKQAEKYRDVYIRYNPTDIIEVDYSVADELEYELRKSVWMKLCEKAWKEYSKMENDDYGLIDFAETNMKRLIEEEKPKTK